MQIAGVGSDVGLERRAADAWIVKDQRHAPAYIGAVSLNARVQVDERKRQRVDVATPYSGGGLQRRLASSRWPQALMNANFRPHGVGVDAVGSLFRQGDLAVFDVVVELGQWNSRHARDARCGFPAQRCAVRCQIDFDASFRDFDRHTIAWRKGHGAGNGSELGHIDFLEGCGAVE